MKLIRKLLKKSLVLLACIQFWGAMSDRGWADETWKLNLSSGWNGFQLGKTGVCWYTFSPDGKLAAASYEDLSIRLWDLRTGREIRRLIGHKNEAKSLCFSPDGKRLVSNTTSDPGDLRLWSVDSGENLFGVPAVHGAVAGCNSPSAAWE